jgi:hypothetical protein
MIIQPIATKFSQTRQAKLIWHFFECLYFLTDCIQIIVIPFAVNPKVDRKDQSCVIMCCSNDGFLRAWCMIKGGGFIIAKLPFKMSDREEITEFIKDRTNSFLLSADGKGYVKIWDVSQVQHQVFQKIWDPPNLSLPKYSRPEFINQLFMWRAHKDAITR